MDGQVSAGQNGDQRPLVCRVGGAASHSRPLVYTRRKTSAHSATRASNVSSDTLALGCAHCPLCNRVARSKSPPRLRFGQLRRGFNEITAACISLYPSRYPVATRASDGGPIRSVRRDSPLKPLALDALLHTVCAVVRKTKAAFVCVAPREIPPFSRCAPA